MTKPSWNWESNFDGTKTKSDWKIKVTIKFGKIDSVHYI